MAKRILITGFEPFDKDENNPSGDLVRWLNKRSCPADRVILGKILPVTFEGGFKSFQEVYDDFHPDIVILTGLAKNRKELTVERIGINWVDARIPDNDGVTITMQKIHSFGPDGLFTTIDIENLITLAKNQGTTLKLSTSAGEYVCNDLLYKVLYYLQGKKSLATFIHIPGLDTYDGTFIALESIVHSI